MCTKKFLMKEDDICFHWRWKGLPSQIRVGIVFFLVVLFLVVLLLLLMPIHILPIFLLLILVLAPQCL